MKECCSVHHSQGSERSQTTKLCRNRASQFVAVEDPVDFHNANTSSAQSFHHQHSNAASQRRTRCLQLRHKSSGVAFDSGRRA